MFPVMASSIWADLCFRNQYSQTPHPCLYLVLQNNNFLNKQTLSPADFRRILKLSQSMSSGILDTRSKLSSWQLQLSLTGQHCPECIDWGSLRSGQFSLSQKSNLHPAQQHVLKIIIFIPKTTGCPKKKFPLGIQHNFWTNGHWEVFEESKWVYNMKYTC